MIDHSYDQIISAFEESANSFKRKNQYFDILYDSQSVTQIEKKLSTETISINVKTSGIVARTFDGTWKEVALDNLSEINNVIEKLPRVINKGEEIAEYEGWTLNKEIKPKVDPRDISIDEKLKKIRDIY
ncbi:MAG: hypothetical protein ACFFAV_18295, partial [Candidatus Hermodarchaeota archaeon]